MKKSSICIIFSPYLVIAFITCLSWPVVRDEPMYIKATEVLITDLDLMLNFCGIGVLFWGVLWKLFGYNVAIFRLAVLCFSFSSIILAYLVSKRFDGQRPWAYAFAVAFLPQFFIYSFQINGLVISVFFSLLILKLHLDYIKTPLKEQMEKSSCARSFYLVLYLCLTSASITNPFLVSLPVAIILTECFRAARTNKITKVSIACLLSIFSWLVYAFIFGEGFEAIATHGVGGQNVNSKFFLFYPGHIAVFLMYLGGTFPFLPFVFGRKIEFRKILPAVLLTGGFIVYMVPLVLDSTKFHFYMFNLVTFAVKHFDLPTMTLEIARYALICLGLYNLVGVLFFAKKNSAFYFSTFALLLYMTLVLIDPYISSRLYVPGIMGLLFIIIRTYEQKPIALYLQMFYQLVLTASYAYGCYLRWGLLRL